MNRPFHRCGRYRKEISLLVSGLLSAEKQIRVGKHLTECAGCQKYRAELHAVTNSIAAAKESLYGLEPRVAAKMKWSATIRALGADSCRPVVKNSGGWLHDFFWAYRYSWSGIAALWLMMWLVNWERPQHAAMTGSSPRTSLIEAMHEQQQLLTELLPPVNPQPAEPPRQRPAPRSERRTDWAAC